MMAPTRAPSGPDSGAHVALILLAATLCALASGLLLSVKGTDTMRSVLANDLPLRDDYDPSWSGAALAYGAPLLVAFLGGTLMRMLHGATWGGLCTFALAGTLAYLSPLLWALDGLASSLDTALQLLEYGCLLPALLMLGGLLAQGAGMAPPKAGTAKPAARTALAVAGALALLALLLALVQVLAYDLPQGADTYADLAAGNAYARDRPVGADSHFKGLANAFYPPGGQAFTVAVAQLAGVPLPAVWQAVPLLTGPVILGAVLLPLARRTGQPTAVLTAGLLLLSWHQVLFIDASARHLSFLIAATGAAALFGPPSTARRVLAVALLAASALVHFSAPAVAAGAAVVVAVASAARPRLPAPRRVMGWAAPSEGLLVAAAAGVLGVLGLLYARVASFGPEGIHSVSEVALGATLPFGFVSLLAGPALVSAPFLLASRQAAPEWRTLAAWTCVFAIVAFYFAHAWTFYHRYFAEIAFVGAIVLTASLLAVALRSEASRRVLAVVVALTVVAVLVPRLDRIHSLSDDVDGRIASRQGVLAAIDGLADPDAVVLIHPDDILNRYVPALTGRYIYCATMDLDRSFQVVSKPLRFLPVVSARNDLARDFFADPQAATLAAMADGGPIGAVVFDARTFDPDWTARLGGTLGFQDGQYVLVSLP